MKDDIQQQLSSFLEEIKKYPCYLEIKDKMEEAKKEIGYDFKDISYLMLAFCRVKIEVEKAGKNNATYKNDTLAQLGDVILDFVIIERGFSKGYSKQQIDDQRKGVGKNERLYDFVKSKKLQRFCYHQKHFYGDARKEDQVSSGHHDSIVEAIIGAIYLDGGLDKTREWICNISTLTQ